MGRAGAQRSEGVEVRPERAETRDLAKNSPHNRVRPAPRRMEPGDVPMSARPTDEEERQESEEKKDAGGPQPPPASLLPVDVNPATSWLKFNQRVLLQATRPGPFTPRRHLATPSRRPGVH